MARLWSCGFELQSATSGVEWTTTTGSPTINTTTVRSGSASLRCNPTAATAFIEQNILAADTATAHMFLRCYLRVASAPSAVTTVMGWTDGTSIFGLRLHPDMTITGDFGSNDTHAKSSALNTGQWYRLELDYDDNLNTATPYIDGVAMTALTGTDMDINGGSRARFGCSEATTADIYFDDCAVNDTTGSAQTGLPGAGNIVHLHPDSAGDNAGWAAGAGGTANFNRVSEVTPDDASTYNKRIATGTLTDDHNLGSPYAAGIGLRDTVTLLQVGVRAGSTSTTTTARDIVLRCKSQASGTVSSSAAFFVATNGWATHGSASPHNYQHTLYVDPQTSGAWTPDRLENAQVGYANNSSSTNEIRVSTVWALVEFVPQPNPPQTFITPSGAAQRAASW